MPNRAGCSRPARALILWFGLLAAVPLAGCASRPAPPVSADHVISAALKTAAAHQKVVLIEFGASWCQWCKHFDALVHAPMVAPVIDANYVVTHLVVQERGDKQMLDNPGADAALLRWGGENPGLPFYVFLRADGATLATSNAMPDGSNIGFPGNARELAAFMALVDHTAPHLDGAGRTALLSYLDQVVPS